MYFDKTYRLISTEFIILKSIQNFYSFHRFCLIFPWKFHLNQTLNLPFKGIFYKEKIEKRIYIFFAIKSIISITVNLY